MFVLLCNLKVMWREIANGIMHEIKEKAVVCSKLSN